MPTQNTPAHGASAHTPGKWSIQREFDNEPIYIVAPHSGETIATVERHPDGDPSADMPNARLIMSAPDLLAALEALLVEYSGPKFSSVANAARAAIARATQPTP